MKWEDRVEFGGLSDVGMRRSNNQDSFRLLPATSPGQWSSRGHVFVVADGMGAHAVGELASKLAVDTIAHTYHKLSQLPCGEAIAKSFQDANALIHARGAANRDFQGMGTTTTSLLLLPQGAVIAHVGDSRAYRVRDGRIEQLSFDHSLAWELVRRRHLTPEQAREIVPSNVITRSLGPEPTVDVDIEGPHPVEPGDVFVLCSDGLSNQVSDPDIGVLARYLPPQDACQFLVDMANLKGGPDNITLIIVQVGEPGQPSTAAAPMRSGPRRTLVREIATAWLTMGIVVIAVAAFAAVLGFLIPNAMMVSMSIAAAPFGLILGAIGIVGRVQQSHTRDEPPPKKQTPYRQCSCPLDKTTIDRFLARLEQLRANAVEHAWNMDWAEFFAHRGAAEKHVAASDFVAALRACGEALHLLAIGQRRQSAGSNHLLGPPA